MKRRRASGEAASSEAEADGETQTQARVVEVTHVRTGSREGYFSILPEGTEADAAAGEPRDDDEGRDDAYVAYAIADVPRCFTLTTPPEPRDVSASTENAASGTLKQGTMSLFHTYCPPALRGRGVAELLCAEAFAWAGHNGLRVDPKCSYVSDTFLSRRPEYCPLVVAANTATLEDHHTCSGTRALSRRRGGDV